jgi:hypothetical protein
VTFFVEYISKRRFRVSDVRLLFRRYDSLPLTCQLYSPTKPYDRKNLDSGLLGKLAIIGMNGVVTIYMEFCLLASATRAYLHAKDLTTD